MVIAKLVTEGRYSTPYHPVGVYSDIRVGFSRRSRVSKELIGIKNMIGRWFDIYFPEFKKVYGSVTAVSGLKILKKAPLPKDILELGEDGIKQIWRDKKVRGCGEKRAKTLVEAAKNSIGERNADGMARLELWQLLEEYEMYQKQFDELNAQLEKLIAQVPGTENLLNIPGVGMVTVAGFLSEVGDISRFTDPKEIQKLAGFAIVENSSGKHKGQSEISRRGRKRLRWVMFQAAISMVRCNSEMKALHEYYTSRAKNPLKKIQSIVAVAGKIIRVFYGILKSNKPYDPERLLKDIRRPDSQAA